jgi:excisionase family DNA binding protein
MSDRSLLTPSDVAKTLAVKKVDSVYRLIATGALKAMNIAAGASRPTWRIREADLDMFLESRRAIPPQPVVRRASRSRLANVPRFFR